MMTLYQVMGELIDGEGDSTYRVFLALLIIMLDSTGCFKTFDTKIRRENRVVQIV